MAPPSSTEQLWPMPFTLKSGHGASLQTRLVGIREIAQQLRALAEERVVSRLGCGSAGVLGLAGTEPWAGSQHYKGTWRYRSMIQDAEKHKFTAISYTPSLRPAWNT